LQLLAKTIAIGRKDLSGENSGDQAITFKLCLRCGAASPLALSNQTIMERFKFLLSQRPDANSSRLLAPNMLADQSAQVLIDA
jgi:hypothetical protein